MRTKSCVMNNITYLSYCQYTLLLVLIKKKLVPLNHCHCSATVDSGNNSRQLKLILTGLNLPLYNKHPEM